MVRKHSSAVYHGGASRMLEWNLDIGTRRTMKATINEPVCEPICPITIGAGARAGAACTRGLLATFRATSGGRTGARGLGLLAGGAAVLMACALGLGGCAGAGASSAGGSSSGAAAAVRSGGGGAGPATTATMAGARCHDGRCACRQGGRDDVETAPPDADHKRFEIRVGDEGGDATLDSPTLGRFSAGAGGEACFYLDVLPGTHHILTFAAHEGRPSAGLSPSLRVAEYGPKGHYWYDVVEVHCAGAGGKCTREAADAWGAEAKNRKRGRIDPCGSAVVTRLGWDTSGGTGDREGGFFRDFTVSFEMEVKRFATQFAPGSTECVPK